MSGQHRRLLVIYLIFGRVHLDSGLAVLKTIADRMFQDREALALVVDNAVTTDIEPLGGVFPGEITGGDNRLHEFSGWDHGYGIARERYRLTDDDVILFANDTFHRHVGRSYLDELTPELLSRRDDPIGAIGYVEDFPRPVHLLGIDYRWWMRSNIFFFSKPVADRLRPLAFPLAPEEIFSEDIRTFWRDTDKISKNWRAYISSWVFGIEDPDYPEYRLHWHSARLPDVESWEYFKIKVRCILSEHYMAARVFQWNIPVIDFNMLECKPDRHTAPYYKQQPG
jgi:hypothetical protein